MLEKKKIKIPVTIYLTPEQIKDIINQLKEYDEDWIDDPQIVSMLEEMSDEDGEEFKEGKTISLEALKTEMGI